MTLVEGVGDEVTQFFIAVVLVLIALAAWWSTSIAEQPLIRTVLILERRTRQRVGAAARQVRASISPSRAEINSSVPTARPTEEFVDTRQAEASRQGSSVETQPEIKTEDELPATEPSSADFTDNSSAEPNASDARPSEDSRASEHPRGSEETTSITRGELSGSAEGVTCQLRRRRLAFFENVSGSNNSISSDNINESGESCNVGAHNIQHPEDVVQEVEVEEVLPGVGNAPGNIRIRLKYLNDEQKLVEGKLQEPLGDFKRRHFGLELGANKLVRLIFNGHVLACDTTSLQEHGLFDNCVVHCLVHQQRNNTNTPQVEEHQGASSPLHPRIRVHQELLTGAAQGEGRDWDLGSVVFMFLSLMLGLAWYGRCAYSQYFTTTASMALVGLTGVFVVSVVGLLLPDHEVARQ